MKLEILKAANGTWSWHAKTNGRIGPAAHGYNTKAGALRALENHFIAAKAFISGLTVRNLPDHWKVSIRTQVRAQVVEQ